MAPRSNGSARAPRKAAGKPGKGATRSSDVRTARSREPAPEGPRAGDGASLQSVIGNRAVSRLLASVVTIAREPDPSAGPPSAAELQDPSFNASSIVNDLRRAIDQNDATLKDVGSWYSAEYVTYRKVDVSLVLKVLDNLTAAQVEEVKRRYALRETNHTLESDLFGGGGSNVGTRIRPDDGARIKVMLRGTKDAPPTPGADATSSSWPTDAQRNHLETIAIEIHDLMSGGTLKGTKLERVMALHRRPVGEIDTIDHAYTRNYGEHLSVDLFSKLEGLQVSRMVQLRSGDVPRADAIAIEAKRRVVEAIDAEAPTSVAGEAFEMLGSFGIASEPDWITKERAGRRQAVVGDIEGIVDQNRREALADPNNRKLSSAEAVKRRMDAVLGTRDGEVGHTLGGELAKTLGPVAAGAFTSMRNGALVESAADQLVAMEASHTTKQERIAEILKSFRTEAEHDLLVELQNPKVPVGRKEEIGNNAEKAKTDLARTYIAKFQEIYEARRGTYRTYAAIVASAGNHGDELLTQLAEGGGEQSDMQEFVLAVKRKNVDGIKGVLERQPNQEAVTRLVEGYEHGSGVVRNLAKDLYGTSFGNTNNALAAEFYRQYTKGAAVTGRDALDVDESLHKPSASEHGTVVEVDWILSYAEQDFSLTWADRGLMGWVREAGEDPETETIMRQTRAEVRELAARWKAIDPWAGGWEERDAILVELRKGRRTLSGDLSAYEVENEKMVDQLKSAVTFAVQVALAIVVPGLGVEILGSALLGTTAVNIGATVVTNMIIQGDKYDLTAFRNDVLGGVLGAAGGKLGEEFVGVIANQVSGRAASAAVAAAEKAGIKTAITAEAGALAGDAAKVGLGTVIAKEGGNLIGSTAGTSIATGENGFTLEGLGQGLLMTGIGKLFGMKPPAKSGAGGEGSASTSEGAPSPKPAVPESASSTSHDTATPTVPDAATPTVPEGAGPVPEAGAPVPETAAPATEAKATTAETATPLPEAVPFQPGVAGAASPPQFASPPRSLEALVTDMPNMNLRDRARAINAHVQEEVRSVGAPDVRSSVDPGRGTGAQFDPASWTIYYGEGVVNGPVDAAQLGAMFDTGTHEAHHAYQWFQMARYAAETGGTRIFDQIPPDVAGLAQAAPPLTPTERATAARWHDSVFGANRNDRNAAYVDMNAYERSTEVSNADLDRVMNDPNATAADRERATEARDIERALFDDAYERYRTLPEEMTAWQRGGVADADAGALMQLRDLAGRVTAGNKLLAELRGMHAPSQNIERVTQALFSDTLMYEKVFANLAASPLEFVRTMANQTDTRRQIAATFGA